MSGVKLVSRCRACGRDHAAAGRCPGCGEEEGGWWCAPCRAWFDGPCCGSCGGMDVPARLTLGTFPAGASAPLRVTIANRCGGPFRARVSSESPHLALPEGEYDFADGQVRTLTGSANLSGCAAGAFAGQVRIEGPATHRVRVEARVVHCALVVPRHLDFGDVSPAREAAVLRLPLENACDCELRVSLQARCPGLELPTRALLLPPRGSAEVGVWLRPAGLPGGHLSGKVFLVPDLGELAIVGARANVLG